ncbi:MAG: hypothetical protein C4531_14725 [Desulfurivibrio sp.]|jgi:fatty acid desaturase|nr:MAG: hypothetical protein C4531_14725 [Desulfurivibrio sp.]
MKETTLTKKRQGVRTDAQAREGLDTFAKSGISVMGGVSALIALWAAACFIGGLISAGGPVELAYSWFKAIAGL